jgi:DNA polymerase-3 subunit gamma/tau
VPRTAGVDVGELGRSFLAFLRDLEVIARVNDAGRQRRRAGGSGRRDRRGDRRGARAGRARGAGLFPVLFDRWARAVDEASRLPTPRLLFEMAALDLCSAEPMVPLGDLLQRLEELEGRLRGSGGSRPAAVAPPGAPPAPAASRSAPATVAAPRSSPRRLRWPRPVPPPAARPRQAAGAAVSPTEEVGEQWRRVLAAFESKGPRLASLLAHAEVVSLTAGDVTLAFASKRDADLADKARAEIEQGASSALGRASRWRSRPAVQRAARSVGGRQRNRRRDADRKHARQEARQHPVIRRAQDVFGAALKEIKT